MLSVTERQWLVPVFIIAVVVGAFYLVTNSTRPPGALAQLPSGGDSRIIVVPVQLERDSYGIALVDTVGQKIWIYKLNSRGPAFNRLELFAARSWVYDKLLDQYNTAEPKPEQVRVLLESLGQLKKSSGNERSGKNLLRGFRG